MTNIWVSDLETESNDFYEKYGYTKSWLTYTENLHDENLNHLSITIDSLYNFILEQAEEQQKSQYVYFHNLSFDGTFILYYLHEKNIKFESTINQFKKIYEIKIDIGNKRYISFRCSYLIFMTSVSNLPNSTKSVIDYERIRNYKDISQATEQEIYYIKQDVKTVKYNLLKLVKQGIKLDGHFKTMASISYKMLRQETDKYLQEKHDVKWWYLFPKISQHNDRYLRNAYFGGYTYLNPKFKEKLIDEKVISYDRVSSYPSVMVNEILPCGKPYKSLKMPKGKLFVVRFRVFKAKIKEGYHPFIATQRKMRYLTEIYPSEFDSIVLTLDSITFDLFNKYYISTYEIIDYMVFPRTIKGIFNNYILKTYQTKKDTKAIKKKAPKDSDEYHNALFDNFWSKLKLNSPYGKFGTNPVLISSKPYFDKFGKLQWKEEREERDNEFYLPLAIFITAYGRLRLIEHIQANRERFIYCDTDSIHLLGTEQPSSLNGLLGNELNKWEHEGTAFKSLYLKPKRYLKLKENKNGKLEISRTIGGLNKTEHHRVNFENFKKGTVIKGGKRIAKNVIGGRIIKPLDFTFK